MRFFERVLLTLSRDGTLTNSTRPPESSSSGRSPTTRPSPPRKSPRTSGLNPQNAMSEAESLSLIEETSSMRCSSSLVGTLSLSYIPAKSLTLTRFVTSRSLKVHRT